MCTCTRHLDLPCFRYAQKPSWPQFARQDPKHCHILVDFFEYRTLTFELRPSNFDLKPSSLTWCFELRPSNLFPWPGWRNARKRLTKSFIQDWRAKNSCRMDMQCDSYQRPASDGWSWLIWLITKPSASHACKPIFISHIRTRNPIISEARESRLKLLRPNGESERADQDGTTLLKSWTQL